MNKKRLVVILCILGLIGAFLAFDLVRFLELELLKSQQVALQQEFALHPWRTAGLYFALYVAVTALSLPGATLLTLAGGAVFGLAWGVAMVSFASSLGATLAFLVARFLLRDMARTRFGARLKVIDRGIERDGAFYLFTLRLVPLFPFFVINLAMGLTPLRARTFYWVSQLGMLAGTVVYVNAGTQLGRLESLEGILSPALILSFALLGLFPWLARALAAWIGTRRALRGHSKPKRFERNLVVIGAGAAGLVAAYIGAALKARVTLIEKQRMGGDCLNTGCVPSKALLRSAKFMSHIRRAREFGFHSASAQFEFAEVMARVRRVIGRIAPHDSAERYAGLGVEVIAGAARVTSPWTVEVGGRTLSTRAIVIATGARPVVPRIAGIDEAGYLTSETVWDLQELPRRLLVLGGGPIGCELAQAFRRLGAQVVLVQRGPRILPREDEDVAALVSARFVAEGIELRCGYEARSFRLEDGRKFLSCATQAGETEIEFDQVLVALGRRASVDGLGLEALGVALTGQGTIEVDECLRSNVPTIYACGDVAGPYQFTHTAAHQAWHAAVNALSGGLKRFRVDYSVIPWATFTEPEVARVGLNEQEARERGIACEVTRYGIDDLDRAIADEEAHGFIKVLTAPGTDRILGVTIAGEHAGDLIAEYVLAMRRGLGLNAILGTLHIYPTLAEANKQVAGAWKRAHAPQRLLRWAERFHGWRRG